MSWWWVGRIYIILQEKKGGHGGVNTNRSRSHPPQPSCSYRLTHARLNTNHSRLALARIRLKSRMRIVLICMIRLSHGYQIRMILICIWSSILGEVCPGYWAMVQNWLLSYRIVINSINTGIKELNCFCVACVRGRRICSPYPQATPNTRQKPPGSPSKGFSRLGSTRVVGLHNGAP